jgi:hypothetical protein
MLLARATSELCRMLFADIIAGLSYTPEEVMSISGQEYVVVPAEAPQTALDAPETPAEPMPAEIVLENVTAPSAVAEPVIETSWGNTEEEWQEYFPEAKIVEAEIVEDRPAPNNDRVASAKQLNMIRAIARGVNIGQDELPALVSGIVGRDINVLQAITMAEVDTIIAYLRKLEG